MSSFSFYFEDVVQIKLEQRRRSAEFSQLFVVEHLFFLRVLCRVSQIRFFIYAEVFYVFYSVFYVAAGTLVRSFILWFMCFYDVVFKATKRRCKVAHSCSGYYGFACWRVTDQKQEGR